MTNLSKYRRLSNRGGEPAAHVNIWYGPHCNFGYPSYSTTSRQNEAPW